MKTIEDLKQLYEDSEDVWFFVTDTYRILGFNKVAYNNGKSLHGKELVIGDSILDYARETTNNVDEDLITCLGRACQGQTVVREQHIEYNSQAINTITTYTPVNKGNEFLGISITVKVTFI